MVRDDDPQGLKPGHQAVLDGTTGSRALPNGGCAPPSVCRVRKPRASQLSEERTGAALRDARLEDSSMLVSHRRLGSEISWERFGCPVVLGVPQVSPVLGDVGT